MDSTAGEPAGKVEGSAIRSGQQARAAKNCAAVMKNLLLIAGLGVLGYLGYQEWFAQPEPKPAAAAVAPPAPVDFAVKTRVRKMFEEWKRRQLTSSQPHGARLTDMSRELDDVRRHLFGKAIHGEKGLQEIIENALRELGVSGAELKQLAKNIIAEARKDASRGGSVIPHNAQIPAMGPRRFGSGD